MFAARKAVFVDLLGWNVPVVDGKYEVDQFDTPSARYAARFLSRLMATTDPTSRKSAQSCIIRRRGVRYSAAL
nr:acyl-homoserine-lactone synthase [Novosphingobium sp.]